MSRNPTNEGEENHSDQDFIFTQTNYPSLTTKKIEDTDKEYKSSVDNIQPIINDDTSPLISEEELVGAVHEVAKNGLEFETTFDDTQDVIPPVDTSSNYVEEIVQESETKDVETGETDSTPLYLTDQVDDGIGDVSEPEKTKENECDVVNLLIHFTKESVSRQVTYSASTESSQEAKVNDDGNAYANMDAHIKQDIRVKECSPGSNEINDVAKNCGFEQNTEVSKNAAEDNQLTVKSKDRRDPSVISCDVICKKDLKENVCVSQRVCTDNITPVLVSQLTKKDFKEALRRAKQQDETSVDGGRGEGRPFIRANNKKSERIKYIQDQLQRAVVFGETRSATDERLRRQLAEAEEMSKSCQGKRRYQRSISRSGRATSKVRRIAYHGKRDRPYRHWLGLSSCVTSDSRFIISSKDVRKNPSVFTGDLTTSEDVANTHMTNIKVDQTDCKCSSCPSGEPDNTALVPANTTISPEDQQSSPLVLNGGSKTTESGSIRAHDKCIQKPTGGTPTLSKKDVVSISYPSNHVANCVDVSVADARASDAILTKWAPCSTASTVSGQSLTSKDTLRGLTSDIAKLSITDMQSDLSRCKPGVCQSNKFNMDELSICSPNERHEYKGSQTLPASLRLGKTPSFMSRKLDDTRPKFILTGDNARTESSAVKPSNMLHQSVERYTQKYNTIVSDMREVHPCNQAEGDSWAPYCSYRSTSPLHLSDSAYVDCDDDAEKQQISTSPVRRFARRTSREASSNFTRNQGIHPSMLRRQSQTRVMRRYSTRNRSKSRDGLMSALTARCNDQYFKAEQYRGVPSKDGVDGSFTNVQQKTSNALSVPGSHDPLGRSKNLRHDMPNKLFQKIVKSQKKCSVPRFITVKALMDYTGKFPGQLSFKAGQMIKLNSQNMESNDGLCYGYYRTGKFKKKKRGVFPAACVEMPSCEPELLVTEL